jgi:hypothetical protein
LIRVRKPAQVQDDDKEEYEETEKDSGEECKVDFGTAHSPLDDPNKKGAWNLRSHAPESYGQRKEWQNKSC